MDFSRFEQWAVPVGSFSRIRVKIHVLLIGFWLYELNDLLGQDIARGQLLLLWVLGSFTLFFTILLHEFGHCFAARRVGGDAEEIILWPLGGLALCHAPLLPRSQFIVAAGGPLVTLVILVVSWIGFFALDTWWPALTQSNLYVMYVRWYLTDLQLFLLIFNSVPWYPLDGGRMFQAMVWARFSRRGDAGSYGHASLITVYVSRVCAALGLAYGLYVLFVHQSMYMIVLALWVWMGTEGLRRQIAEGAEQDYSFGYDFSRGYTSLESSQPRAPEPRRKGAFRGWLRGRRKRPFESAQPSSEERERVDALLAKIQREGMPSLTREERKFLDRVSRRYR